LGDATGTASIASSEVDWFKFTAATTGSHVLEATTPSSSLDTVIGLFSSTGARLGYNDDISSSNTDSRFSLTLTAGQVYYLGVTNYSTATTGAYTWKIDGPSASAPPPTDDAYEDNDTLATASNLGTLSSQQTINNLQMQDAADWFKFTMNGTGTTSNFVSTAFTHSAGDIDMKLFNSAGTQIGASEGSTNEERISLSGLASGTYYVQVFGYNGARNPSYSLTVNPATTSAPPPTQDAWTLFVYVTASDLQQFAFEDINEMEKAASQLGTAVNIVVFWDQSNSLTKYATGNGSQAAWGTAGQAVIQADTNMNSVATTFQIVGEKNTGNPTTLTDFLRWGQGQAPAQRYALMLWNHGAGIYGSNYDDSDGTSMDFLSITEVNSAVTASGVPLSLIGYDACLMGMAEIGHTLQGLAPVFVASEELEDGTGHDYTTLLNVLQVNPASVTPEQLGSGMVTSFGNQYVGTGTTSDTYSATRTSNYASLASALKTFTSSTSTATSSVRTRLRTAASGSVQYDGQSYKDFRDLGSFMRRVAADTGLSTTIRNAANGVLTALNGLVISKTNDQRASSGVAIYLPLSSYDSTYATNFSAFNTAAGWGSFAKWLATGTRTTSSTSGSTPTRGPAQRTGTGRSVVIAEVSTETSSSATQSETTSTVLASLLERATPTSSVQQTNSVTDTIFSDADADFRTLTPRVNGAASGSGREFATSGRTNSGEASDLSGQSIDPFRLF
jgi:hypothetical protein